MGNSNETLRTSRSAGASIFRRHTQRRRSASSIGGAGGGVIAEEEIDRTVAVTGGGEFGTTSGSLTPKPARRMDKIRRSLSFRKKKKSSKSNKDSAATASTSGGGGGRKAITDQPTASQQVTSEPNSIASTANNTTNQNSTTTATAATPPTAVATTTSTTGPNRPALWVEDERRVRGGNCSFQVKYLGYLEVTDSRGMHICEQALEKLLLVRILFSITNHFVGTKFLFNSNLTR
jgi:hypothetical protein